MALTPRTFSPTLQLVGAGWLLACSIATGCTDDPPPGDTGDGGDPVDTDCPDRIETLSLTADESGWVDGCSNSLGIQGHWYTYDDGTSTIERTFSAPNVMCASGTAATSGDDVWGAGLGFDLCKEGPEESSPTHGIDTCPRNLSALEGFRLTVTGTLPTSELRVTFSEVDRDQSAYVVVTAADEPTAYRFDEAEVWYDASAPPIDTSRIRALQFQIASLSSGEVSYDFCIEDIEAIVGGGADGDSDADTDSDSDADSDADEIFVGNITTNGSVRTDFMTYWDQITPENEGKWGSVEGTRDSMNWNAVRRVYDFAETNNIPFKQHTFVWGSQYPTWIDSLGAAEQAEEIEEWIAAFCSEFPNTALIDVVNEAVAGHAPAAYAENAFGSDWIIRSFELAHQYCPNATLILNDYNVLRWNTSEFITLATPVIAAGLVDGVGCQAHSLGGHNSHPVQSINELRTNLDRIAGLGVDVYISEYDIEQTDDAAQLAVMQEQFPLFYEHPSVKGITLWGYLVGATWREGTGLLHSDGSPRPALTWLMDYLQRN